MSDETARQGLSTTAVHAGSPEAVPGEPVVNPVVQSATFFNAPVPEGEVRYGRYANTPNHEALAAKLAALEGAESALAVGSGMGAISLTMLAFVGSGDHILAAHTLYGGTMNLLTRELPRLGIETTFVHTPGRWRGSVRPNTRLLYVEVPVNPTLSVPDIRPLADLARERGLPLVVDATFATPINFRPIEHRADVVVHSGTKYLGGHSDVVAGVVAGPAAVVEEVRTRLKAFGQGLDPHALWLLERGIKTLAVRMERHNANGLRIARWLEGHDAVAKVFYPGLESHPDHALVKALFDGFGGMVSMVVKGGDEAAVGVMERLRLIRVAPSLGGVESLASMPRYTSHASLSEEERHALGIDDGFIRLSLGVEDPEDLEADLAQALESEG
jgi:cystathionine beta-lyase/cystathionine gamma-synthase